MACPHQDPNWWKRAQLLLAEDVESNRDPCGTVLYVHIKSPHIKPLSNTIIPPLTDSPQMLKHQTQILLTLIHMPHTKSLSKKILLTYTI